MLFRKGGKVGQGFRIKEFAARAGVTAKALHLYDRLGLLVPERSRAGHRVYAARDLTRVRQIVALKTLGMPLRRIGVLLNESGPPLHAVIHHQRRVLEEQRRILDRTIRVLERAEHGLQAPARNRSQILDTLIEAISMQESIDAMRKYYSDEAWQQWREHYEHWPSEAWRTLYREINAALDANPDLEPTSDVAQTFATRWLALDASDTDVLAVRAGLRRAWADREHWPEAMQRRLEGLQVDRAARFVSDALWERWDAERLARELAGGAVARVSEGRRRLYHDGAALLGCDPRSEEVVMLVERWLAIVDEETGGDAESKAEMMRSFRARSRWPAGLVRSMAASYGLDPAIWVKVAALIEAAHDGMSERAQHAPFLRA